MPVLQALGSLELGLAFPLLEDLANEVAKLEVQTVNIDLQAIVDRALDESNIPDPAQLVGPVLMRIPVGQLEEALRLALATYIETRIYERQSDPMPSHTIHPF